MASLFLAGLARAAAAAAASSRRLLASSALDPLPLLLSLPSTSPLRSLPSSSRSLSSRTRPPLKIFTKAQRKRGKLRKRLNLEKRVLLERLREETKPDPVLGYRHGNTREVGTNDENLWNNCELKKILVSNHDVWGFKEDSRGNLQAIETELSAGTQEEQQIAASQGGPLRLNFTIPDSDRKLLFKDLPEVNTRDRVTQIIAHSESDPTGSMVADDMNQKLEAIERQEKESTDKLTRILDLRNASAKGIDVYNKKRIVEHFGGGVDTGSVETQVAIITYRLHRLYDILHTPRFRKDEVSRRSMTILTHQRAKLLKYLKRESLERYTSLLSRVGVNPRAVEGEIVVPGRPKLMTVLSMAGRIER